MSEEFLQAQINDLANQILEMRRTLESTALAPVKVTRLDEIASDAGTQRAGRWITGDLELDDENGQHSGTGMFMGNAAIFDALNFVLAFVKNGVLQWGGTDTADFVAGRGAVMLSALGQIFNTEGVFLEFNSVSGGVGEIGALQMVDQAGLSVVSFRVTSQLTVVNNDFESGTIGWDLSGTAAVVDTVSHSPSHSASLPASSDQIQSHWFIDVTGKSALLDFWVYGGSASAIFASIFCYDSGGAFLGNANNLYRVGTQTGIWTRYMIVGQYISGTVKIKLNFANALTGGKFVDDIAVYDGEGFQIFTGLVSGAPNAMLNGGFSATGAVTGSNLSGTNTGDETTATIAAKAIDDAIADGVTNKAPSQNAVFDALATKMSNSVADANSILYATTDNTPAALALAANQFPARGSSGNIVAKALTDYALSLLDDANAATARATLGISFVGTLFGHGQLGTVPAGATRFLGSIAGMDTSDPNASVHVNEDCTLKYFYIRTASTQPGTGTLDFTLRINGVETTITCTVAINGVAALFSDLTHTASISRGQRVTVKAVNNASGASAQIAGWSVGMFI